jgi:hypothetical protein
LTDLTYAIDRRRLFRQGLRMATLILGPILAAKLLGSTAVIGAGAGVVQWTARR